MAPGRAPVADSSGPSGAGQPPGAGQRRGYGASWLHLVAVLGGLVISGYAASRIAGLKTSTAVDIAIWFVAAAVAHDLVVLPAYSLLAGLVGRGPTDTGSGRARPGPWWRNHLRIPAGLSLLLLVVYLPLIARFQARLYHGITGLSTDVYLAHWAWVTGILFGLSALALGVRAVKRARRHPRRR